MLACTSLPLRSCLSAIGGHSRSQLNPFRYYIAGSSYCKWARRELPLSAVTPAKSVQVRFYSAAKPKPSSDKSLQQSSESASGSITLTTAEKVKENVKTASYTGEYSRWLQMRASKSHQYLLPWLSQIYGHFTVNYTAFIRFGVIIIGVGIGGAILYYVLYDLLSSESPNSIYSHAFKMCKLSNEVNDVLGTPIKCYGEESRRGWRRHVACQEYLYGDTKFLRMKFYIEGQFKKGTVNVEKRTNEKGKYQYTYIIVDVDGYPARRIDVPF